MATDQAPLSGAIEQSWGWTGLTCARIVGHNDFGNVLCVAADAKVWRICPESLTAEVVAPVREASEAHFDDPGLIRDWNMDAAVSMALVAPGPLPRG